MNREKIFGVLRHLLTFGGGYLVAKGYVPEGSIDDVVAAIITILGVVWSVSSPEKKKVS